MHWTLSTTGEYSLRQTIRQSSWILHAPFHTTHMGNQLMRIERIASEKTIAVVIAQNSRNIIIRTSGNLTGSEIEELTKRTRRMLRLSENFKPFHNLINANPLQIRQDLTSPAILRGTSLFEDIVRATAIDWNLEGHVDANKYTWLVDHFGDPLPSNPTLHALPEPSQILRDQDIVSEQLHPQVGETIIHVANIFETQDHKIGTILDQSIPSSDLSKELKHLLHLDDTPLSQVMLSLGRYDYIPADSLARERWRRFADMDINPLPMDVRHQFETWQPFGGLAYWLWDWTAVKQEYLHNT